MWKMAKIVVEQKKLDIFEQPFVLAVEKCQRSWNLSKGGTEICDQSYKMEMSSFSSSVLSDIISREDQIWMRTKIF